MGVPSSGRYLYAIDAISGFVIKSQVQFWWVQILERAMKCVLFRLKPPGCGLETRIKMAGKDWLLEPILMG